MECMFECIRPKPPKVDGSVVYQGLTVGNVLTFGVCGLFLACIALWSLVKKP